MLLAYFLSIAIIGLLASVSGLQCNEGFNASISGIPLYHWVENSCNRRSQCFSQQLKVSMAKFAVTIRYGGCVSSVYAPYLTCKNLFGPNSRLDPVMLLNLIPDLDQKFKHMATLFADDAIKQFHTFLSSGNASEGFIPGMMKFGENLGFNMEKLKKLERPMTKAFGLLFVDPHPYAFYFMQATAAELLHVLKDLGTESQEVEENVYKFMSNFLQPQLIEEVKDTMPYSTLVENFPGLVKSTLPRSWWSDTWFEALFEMLGEIQFENLKLSVMDIIATLKATYEPYALFAPTIEDYFGPIYDSLPELVDQLAAGNGSYAAYWSVELLKSYSVTNNATEKLHNSFMHFLEGLGIQDQDLSLDVKNMIEWLPGIFYRLFPGRKEDISEAYQIMADGFNSFEPNIWTDTKPESELSKFITMMAKKLMPLGIGKQFTKYVNNFSQMFYQLLHEYTVELDIFLQTLSEGLKNYPEFNTGKIITELVTKYGKQIPIEAQPLILNLKDSFVKQPFERNDFFSAATKMIQAYNTTFPLSEFPDLIYRYINLIEWISEGTISFEQFNHGSIGLFVDFSFAVFDELGFGIENISKAFEEAFPEYATYVKMMRMLDRDDVKQLLRNLANWVIDGSANGKLTYQGFVDAMKPIVDRVVDKLMDVISQLQRLLKPDYCDYKSCSQDLCNS